MIKKIQGLEELTKLTNLNLSGNEIELIDGLNLPMLKTLNLSNNKIIYL